MALGPLPGPSWPLFSSLFLLLAGWAQNLNGGDTQGTAVYGEWAEPARTGGGGGVKAR